jgi:membrane-associated progesterone receptor component
MIVFPDIFPRSGSFMALRGPYSLFAGRDATRALALMSFDPNDLTGDLDGLSLSPDELEVLQDWEEKIQGEVSEGGCGSPCLSRCGRQAGSGQQNTARPHHEDGDA